MTNPNRMSRLALKLDVPTLRPLISILLILVAQTLNKLPVGWIQFLSCQTRVFSSFTRPLEPSIGLAILLDNCPRVPHPSAIPPRVR